MTQPLVLPFDDAVAIASEYSRILVTPDRQIVNFSILEDDVLLSNNAIIRREDYSEYTRPSFIHRIGRLRGKSIYLQRAFDIGMNWYRGASKQKPLYVFSFYRDITIMNFEDAYFVYKHVNPRSLSIYELIGIRKNNWFKPLKIFKNDFRDDIRDSIEDDADFVGYDF